MANILTIDDDRSICELISTKMSRMGHNTAMAKDLTSGLAKALEGSFDVVFLDLNLPDGHGLTVLPDLKAMPGNPEVIIITGVGDSDGAEAAFKSGAWDFVQKPVSFSRLTLPLTRALQYRQEKQANQRRLVLQRDEIVGHSVLMKECLNQVAQAALSDTSVLILGETGTGKELIAKAIYENSARVEKAFIIVDCAALPPTLVESLLFGHVKGAFTGAEQESAGLVSQADGGVLFLDEIGDLPLSVQKSFLRVLQERKFRPVGSKKEYTSDFRLVAATNRDLNQMVKENKFRGDLLFRLGGMRLRMPPLRKRKEDICELLLHFISRLSGKDGLKIKGFTPEFLQCLEKYDWPGNIREFINVLESALVKASDSPTLYPLHLPAALRLSTVNGKLANYSEDKTLESNIRAFDEKMPSIRDYRAQMDEAYLKELIIRTNGRVKEAAEIAQLSESRLHALLKKYGTPRLKENRKQL